MSTLDDIAQERQRIAERLARLDAERTKLAEQLGELEVAERVLSRFGGNKAEKPARGRPAKAKAKAPATGGQAKSVGRGRPRRAAQDQQSLPLSEATMRAVRAHPDGARPEEVRAYLASEFGQQVRPNHLGMALQRHRRAGRMENRDGRWHLAQQDSGNAEAAE